MKRALAILTPIDNCGYEQNLIPYKSVELLEAEINFVFHVQWSSGECSLS
jgi:hypothetical protein